MALALSQPPALSDDHLYTLVCPSCNAELADGLWFVNDDLPDNHGLVCCTGCITQMVRLSGLPRRRWKRRTRSEYRKYYKHEWDLSLSRTDQLVHGPASSADDNDSDDGNDSGDDNDEDDDSATLVPLHGGYSDLVNYLVTKVREAGGRAGLPNIVSVVSVYRGAPSRAALADTANPSVGDGYVVKLEARTGFHQLVFAFVSSADIPAASRDPTVTRTFGLCRACLFVVDPCHSGGVLFGLELRGYDKEVVSSE